MKHIDYCGTIDFHEQVSDEAQSYELISKLHESQDFYNVKQFVKQCTELMLDAFTVYIPTKFL